MKRILACALQNAFKVFLFLCFLAGTTYALDGAHVAIYNDSIVTSQCPGCSGVWQDGLTAMKNMLTYAGYSYEEITYLDLNYSSENFSSLYRIILIPGGYAAWYNYWISKAGKKRIRDFVNNGGGYFGICAGAYFAADKVVWKGVTYDDNAGYYNAFGELTGYDLDLFAGTGTGPINQIADWNTVGYNMTTINFQTPNSVLNGYKQVPYSEDILYYGGPYFTLDPGSNAEVLATYAYNGRLAAVAFSYGAGRVVLMGPHPEIEEDSNGTLNDNGSDWDLARYMLDWLMNSPVSHSLTPPPVSSVSQGGNLGPVYAHVSNNSNSSSSFYLLPFIKSPNGSWTQFTKHQMTLAAGETNYANNGNSFYIGIPSAAPAGNYQFCIKAFDAGNNLLDQDCFPFQVTAGVH